MTKLTARVFLVCFFLIVYFMRCWTSMWIESFFYKRKEVVLSEKGNIGNINFLKFNLKLSKMIKETMYCFFFKFFKAAINWKYCVDFGNVTIAVLVSWFVLKKLKIEQRKQSLWWSKAYVFFCIIKMILKCVPPVIHLCVYLFCKLDLS